MNNAPFHIGQRVVCVDDSKPINEVWGSAYPHKKGQVLVVTGIYGKHPDGKEYIMLDNDERCFWAKRYAPINTRSVEIDETIKEQAEEMIRVKETIKELNPSLC